MRKSIMLGAAGVFALTASVSFAEPAVAPAVEAEAAASQTVGVYVLSIKGAG